MPTYLDFESTKSFRDSLISKTLQAPNGPQTFSSTSYSVEKTNSFSNKDLGDVVINDGYNRVDLLKTSYSINRFGPENEGEFIIIDEITTIPSLGNLAAYPYFEIQDVLGRNLIGALNSSNYEFESKLAQFSNKYLKDDPNGPVQSRIRQNLETATLGRLRILDALNGNTASAINIIRGKESLIEKNNKITVAKTLAGKGIDFIQTVSGIESPFSEIPGQYLTDPSSPVNYRPEPNTSAGALIQDVTGAIGSIVGIKRRPKRTSKPSDLMYEYMGSGQKDVLHDNLSFSTYKPDYTTVARSQQSSKLFNFPGAIAQGIKNVLGVEAPIGNAYIGDDRAENVIYASSDFNDNIVKSPYYISLLFDPIQARFFQNEKNISEGGQISGKLTWYSKNSKNKLGEHNEEYSDIESSKFLESLSTKTEFRSDSILSKTQELLNSMPLDGAQSRTHVGNAIDQTSRIFKEGDVFISRGSAIKYVNKKTGKEDGTEYCRVWTKDRSYMNYSDTMKRTGLIRGSVDSVISTPFNLNIAPISNGNRDFSESTNITGDSSENSFDGKAKKYMFSIENLAWKTSNKPGFTVSDLPICERGSNGGRVMWFPPYDLKVSEVNSVSWDSNKFLGRPEPVYTYQGTERGGTISFKVIVDHPSILNLLLKNISDEEAENFLNAFFAGCETVDFYQLAIDNKNLDKNDLELLTSYLEYYRDGKTSDTINSLSFKSIAGEQTTDKGTVIGGNEETTSQAGSLIDFSGALYFPNDIPKPNNDIYADIEYDNVYTSYTQSENAFIDGLEIGLNKILTGTTNGDAKDREVIFGTDFPLSTPGLTIETLIDKKKGEIINGFDELEVNFISLNGKLDEIKTLLAENKIVEFTINITSKTSFVADNKYNIKLSYRRADSIFKYITKYISKNGDYEPGNYWRKTIKELDADPNISVETIKVTANDLGYSNDNNAVIILKFTNQGETTTSKGYDCANLEVTTKELKLYAPLTFFCRSVDLKLTVAPNFITTNATPGTTTPSVTTIGPSTTQITVDNITKNRKPPLDAVKKIVMKSLSECFYFKKLEESDPIVFGSLKEKIKYFHPAFHSMTPEGLNSRLTFLHQCIRPGDTIPVKGLGRETDVSGDARNTSFGPPPICILRIGDFYHSKIVISNVNISYENSTWDMNPEGIGMQPMVADVSLQVNFIGGQGMKEPVAKLQNALSSNFYANTEIYDYRADATADLTDDLKQFNIDFLEKITASIETPKNTASETSPDSQLYGNYLGTIIGDKINYSENIKTTIKNTNDYFDLFGRVYNHLITSYGADILPLFISPIYRVNNTMDVQNTITTTTDINLLGKYKIGNDFTVLLTQFETKLFNKVNTSDHNFLLDLDFEFGTSKYERSRKIIDQLISDYFTKFITDIRGDKQISLLENSRNSVIENLDKLNFIMKTNGIDGKLNNENNIDVIEAKSLVNFEHNEFYGRYEKIIELFKTKHIMFTDGLNNTFDFNSTIFTDENYKKLLAIIVDKNINNIIQEYENSADNEIFTSNTIKKIEKRLKKFIDANLIKSEDKKFKFKKVEIKKELEPYSVTTGTLSTNQEDELKKIHNIKDSSTESKLNFLKLVK